MHPGQLAAFKTRLTAKKAELAHTLQRLEATGLNSALSGTTGELSTYDNHPADLGSETFERSKDLGLHDNEQVLLSNVERALEKIHNGTYGRCDHCGAEIAPARLEAQPWATQCIHCQENLEKTAIAGRPLEEEALAPPFQRSFLDADTLGSVGYDGEDALQAVARYGSSDTPQDIPGSTNYKALFPNSNEHLGMVEPADAIPSEPDSASHQARKRQKKETGR
ncbi:TraR/DksA C4-type zinc finger protein [Sporomusa termitida]|uniref:RNA polymerase-binding transcription factor DksA n=1 Tax=Sporomusa termitida TaxID=2377 RepID=A0A517DTK7_9FIRM|nr:TraR/DksA C4-type zinc finger protein [Sporomusa termitida]QDR80694.1 RNA polymerase-binding transcription factor DksA [Sporomusa termitida]